jgi:putative nucleotidyltransferase with HDIG domain
MSALTSEMVAKRVRELPALPAVVRELIECLGHEDVSAAQIAGKIAQDQALAAKTLRLANSSFYGLPRKVSSIAEASTILGLRMLRSVVVAAGLTSTIARRECEAFDFEGFWRHSIGTALCARALAKSLRFDEETAFTLGLLHDIGRLALVSSFPQRFSEVLRYQREADCLPSEAEQFVLGVQHDAVGALVAEHWRFSPAIVEAVAGHHEPHGEGSANLAELVHVADNIAHALDLSGTPDDMVPPLSQRAWSRLGMNPVICAEICAQARTQFADVCRALLSHEETK